MVFKKKNDKKKKKSKATKKDDWSHEGGVTIEEQGDANDETRKKRIHTQEKDERLRRSRRKHEDQRIKTHFVKKMSQKVKFSDILAASQQTQPTTETGDVISIETSIRKPNAPHSNPLSAMERLQGLIRRKRPRTDSDRENVSEHEEEISDSDEIEEGAEINANESAEQDISSFDSKLVFGGDVKSQKVKDHEVEEWVDDSDEENAKKPIVNVLTYCDWFFKASNFCHSMFPSSSASLSQPEENMKKENVKRKEKAQFVKNIMLGDVECGFYTAFSANIPNLPVSNINYVQDIAGIYKLWKCDDNRRPFNDFSKELLPYLLTYADALLEGRNHENDKIMLECMLMHCVFHVVKARAKVVKHNDKLKRKAKDQKLTAALNLLEDDSFPSEHQKSRKSKKLKQVEPPSSNTARNDDGEENDAMRDQGFTRPRLLILCPFRSSAKFVVTMLLKILGENTSISGLEKFDLEFADPDDSEDEGGKKASRPADWDALFKGNMDDDFKLGIQINPDHGKGSGSNKGVYARLFSDFYISDIIVASPIGLKLAMESNPNKLNVDFLTSIEQVVIHQADVISMQNWEHVDFILRHVNRLPKEHHEETDYSRVRSYFLDGNGAEHRQLMMSTHFNTPELQAFFREFARSKSGQVRLKRNWSPGCISNVLVPVKQTFQLIPSISSLQMEEDLRFDYFKNNVLSQILRLKQNRTLIFAPSYLQYVRIRNELIRQEASAVFVCEYSRDSEISRGRSWFYQGVKNILVYSGRAHFFRRFKIRGAKHLIFYSCPEYPHFYPEMVNVLGEVVQKGEGGGDVAEEMSCLTLFTPCDKMALDRIIGPKRADHMLSSNKSTFLFF